MKMEEQIQKMKSELIRALNNSTTNSKEEVIELLEKIGLNSDMAIKLLNAFGDMKSAKRTAENVWNTALNSSNEVGIDYSTDIRKSSDAENRMTRYFENIHSRCAFLMALKNIDPNEINEEILEELYEEGINENEIINPVLKTTYHYYNESKAKDRQLNRAVQKEKNLTEQLRCVEQNYTNLNDKFKLLKKSYENLQTKFQERIALDEKHYQIALSQVKALKNKLEQMEERGILKIIGDKVTGLFANTRKLTESTAELPNTLLQTKSEKIGIREFDGNEIVWAISKSDIKQTTEIDRTAEGLEK